MEDKLRFLSLASSSNGNCYYLGNSVYGILIDAGVAMRTLKKRLKDIGVEIEQIHAVFITHEHFDHTKSVGNLTGKHQMPVYATAKVHEGIAGYQMIMKKHVVSNQRYIEYGETITIGEFQITSFPLPHDSQDNSGYVVTYRDKTFTFATDLGCATEMLCRYIAQSNFVLLEANYDENMLKAGNYPEELKQRIAGNNGHLSNRAAAEVLSKHATDRLSHIFLCHLSRENNTFDLALKTVSEAVDNTNVEITVLPHYRATKLFELT
jgi:phosphoribosyl 1,2-cyclic phosphodiesterase